MKKLVQGLRMERSRERVTLRQPEWAASEQTQPALSFLCIWYAKMPSLVWVPMNVYPSLASRLWDLFL